MSDTAGDFDLRASGQQVLERHKSLTFLNGLSLIVGLVIGSGIFSSPASVSSNVGSPAAALLVWAIAGLLAWTGAASYAELGGAIPLNGGAQVYLSKIFGEWAGFLFTWCAVTVLKPGSAAIIAIIFGEYMVRAIVGTETTARTWLDKTVALGGLLLVVGLNCVSTKMGARCADLFMFLKFVGLLVITVVGIVVAATGLAYDSEALSQTWKSKGWFADTSASSSQWAVALYAGLWAYDGWDNTNYVVGEMLHPQRDLPRTIHTALPLVIVAYLLANLAYIFVLPPDIINASNTIAVAFGRTVFGPIGALAVWAHRVWFVLWRSQRHDLHRRSPGVQRGEGRIHPVHLRDHRALFAASSHPFASSRRCQTTDSTCRRRARLLLHTRVRDDAQPGAHVGVHYHWRLHHADDLLRRGELPLLLCIGRGSHHSASQGTRAGTPVSLLDRHSRHLLLREFVSDQPSDFRKASASVDCGHFYRRWVANLLVEDRQSRSRQVQGKSGHDQQVDLLETGKVTVSQCLCF